MEAGGGGKSLVLLGGEYIFTRKAAFLYRENGSSMHGDSRKNRWRRGLHYCHRKQTFAGLPHQPVEGVGILGGRGWR